MIEQELKSLREDWDFTTEQLNHLRLVMANYALAALMDSAIAKEAEKICQEATDDC